MADNVLETVQKLIQDVIAPDVRELKARVDSLEKRMDERFKVMEEMNATNFARVLSAINEGKSLGELAAVREMAPLRERVAVLEERIRSAA